MPTSKGQEEIQALRALFNCTCSMCKQLFECQKFCKYFYDTFDLSCMCLTCEKNGAIVNIE